MSTGCVCRGLGSVPSTPMVTHICLELRFHGIPCPLLDPAGTCTHVIHKLIHTDVLKEKSVNGDRGEAGLVDLWPHTHSGGVTSSTARLWSFRPEEILHTYLGYWVTPCCDTLGLRNGWGDKGRAVSRVGAAFRAQCSFVNIKVPFVPFSPANKHFHFLPKTRNG